MISVPARLGISALPLAATASSLTACQTTRASQPSQVTNAAMESSRKARIVTAEATKIVATTSAVTRKLANSRVGPSATTPTRIAARVADAPQLGRSAAPALANVTPKRPVQALILPVQRTRALLMDRVAARTPIIFNALVDSARHATSSVRL